MWVKTWLLSEHNRNISHTVLRKRTILIDIGVSSNKNNKHMHFLLKCLSSENSFSSEYLDFYLRKFNPNQNINLSRLKPREEMNPQNKRSKVLWECHSLADSHMSYYVFKVKTLRQQLATIMYKAISHARVCRIHHSAVCQSFKQMSPC